MSNIPPVDVLKASILESTIDDRGLADDTQHAPIENRHKIAARDLRHAIADLFGEYGAWTGIVDSKADALFRATLADEGAREYARGQLAGMELACRAVCARCKREEPVSLMPSGEVWVHGTEIEERCGGWTCEATRIRNAMKALQDAGGAE